MWEYSYYEGGTFLDNLKSVYGAGAVKQSSQLLLIEFTGDKVKTFTHSVGK